MKKFRILCMVLVLLLTMNSLAFADTYTDVSEDNWAAPYVEKVTSSDVMPAYSDGTFRPMEKMTKMAVIDTIYRIALIKGEVTTAEVDQYLVSYQKAINDLVIPMSLEPFGSDNHRAIAYALDRGILRTSELSLFYVNGKFDLISKVDASVYMAKALNVYLEENVNKFYEIRYKDGGEITLMAWPYVNLLIEKEIVSSSGSNGYFYPNAILNRDVFSVIATGVLRELEGFKKNDGITEVKTSDSNGKISIIHYDKNIIEIRNQYNTLNIYDAAAATLTLNGETIALHNLEPGMDVKISTNGKTLISLDVDASYDIYKGTLNSVGIWIDDTKNKETYKAVVANVGTTFKYLKALSTTIVERDYQTSTLDEIDENDEIVMYYEGDYLKKIESFSNKVILEGALERSSAFLKGDDISIKLFNGKLIEQVLATDITKINMTQALIKGDIVRITMSQGKITAVEATGFSTEATGRVTEITISQNPKITLVDSKGIAKTFNIAKNVVVKNLGAVDSNGLYTLRLDQDVTLELTGVTVSSISINKAVEKTEFEANITEVHKNINLLKAIDKNNKTWIVSLEGSDQNISDYTVGDKVYIYGVELSQDLFEADLIVVLE